MADRRTLTTSRKAHAPASGALSRLRSIAPAVTESYERLAAHAAAAGPLDAATVATVKVAMSVGRGSWRGVHAHTRKALEAGVSADALRQVAIVAVPTVGLHGALDALRWIEEVIEEGRKTRGAPRARQAAGGRR